MRLHSAQKSCQEATWEFPGREIELVLTQAERKAVAESWIIVLNKVPAAGENAETCFPSCLAFPEVRLTKSPFIASV